MTKQPGIQQVGILLAPTVVFIHFHDTFFSPPHTGVAANDDDESTFGTKPRPKLTRGRGRRVYSVVVLLGRRLDIYVYCRYL